MTGINTKTIKQFSQQFSSADVGTLCVLRNVRRTHNNHIHIYMHIQHISIYIHHR